jgi:serine protease Do
MDLKWINDAEQAIVQIATPFSTGTGFIFPGKNIIVTNEHVIRDNNKVVIEGKHFERQSVEVVFCDEKYDIAFLLPPKEIGITFLQKQVNELELGDVVFALGHPFGLKFSATKGIISSLDYETGGIRYIQHDAALNPGNSGGPLLTSRGELAGVNTFIHREGQSIGIALTLFDLQKMIDEYANFAPNKAIRCTSCEQFLLEKNRKDDYCSNCGTPVKYLNDIDDYEPLGMNKKIEDVITSLGFDVEICRRGSANWEITSGSAKVNIAYHEKSGFLVADATLCYLPKTNMEPIYTYLMKQNYFNKGISFSLKDNNIVMSSLIYDQHMHFETCKKILDKLIRSADKYDNILVDSFGAIAV